MNKKEEEGKRQSLYLDMRKRRRKKKEKKYRARRAQAHLITPRYVLSFVHHHHITE